MRHPSRKDSSSMPSVAYMVDRIAARRRGHDLRETWRNAAAFIGIAPGTVENIQRERLKFTDRVRAKIEAAFVRVLEAEIQDALAELDMVLQGDSSMDSSEIQQARAALAARIKEAQEVIGQ